MRVKHLLFVALSFNKSHGIHRITTVCIYLVSQIYAQICGTGYHSSVFVVGGEPATYWFHNYNQDTCCSIIIVITDLLIRTVKY